MGLLEREMIEIIVLITKGGRLGERQITEIMVTFSIIHRVVLVPLPQNKIAGVVAMVVVPKHQLAVMVVPEDEVMVVRLAKNKVVVVRVAEAEVVVAEIEPVVVMVLPEGVVALPQRQLGGVLPVPQDQLVVGHHQSPPRNSTSSNPNQWRLADGC